MPARTAVRRYVRKKNSFRKMKKILFWVSLSVVMFTSCRSHYVLTDVNRSRLVIDSRYDAQPDAAASAFLAPYKQEVDSVMEPVMGTVARNMEAKRPESPLTDLLSDILMDMSASYGEKPDFSVYNIGGIRASLVKGKVTYGDILAVAPFENLLPHAHGCKGTRTVQSDGHERR